MEAGEAITGLGLTIEGTKASREFDSATQTKLIECKNIDWTKQLQHDGIDSICGKFGEQAKVANEVSKKFEVYSKQLIPIKLKSWFIKKGITFFEEII